MPELPEVETIRKTLLQLVKHKTIEDVTVFWPKIIKYPDDVEQFKFLCRDQTIHDIGRKGKFLLFELDDYVLVSHLRMEGKYRLESSTTEIDKHTHVIFTFTDGDQLRYHDVRKFGTMHLFPRGQEADQRPLNQLGPDPFEDHFTLDYFYKKCQKTTRTIKAVLLDQTVVAGLGNIYVDETLFQAGIHPLTRANQLTKSEVAKIQKYAKLTLEKAVAQGGTTIRSYVNGEGEMGMFQQELYVYGQQDKPCRTCGQAIIKMKVAGRGTHVCPSCQPEARSS